MAWRSRKIAWVSRLEFPSEEIEISTEDFLRYALPAMDKHAETDPTGWVDYSNRGRYFFNLLGLNFTFAAWVKNPTNVQPMPDDLKKLLIALAGPHGDTVLKVYRIQHGLEK